MSLFSFLLSNRCCCCQIKLLSSVLTFAYIGVLFVTENKHNFRKYVHFVFFSDRESPAYKPVTQLCLLCKLAELFTRFTAIFRLSFTSIGLLYHDLTVPSFDLLLCRYAIMFVAHYSLLFNFRIVHLFITPKQSSKTQI